MSRKLKFAGASLLVVLAASVGSLTANAETGGHFVSEADSTTLTGTEGGTTHNLHFRREGEGPGGQIGCVKDAYTGSMNATATTVTITPTWSECYTTGNPSEAKFDIIENGCDFFFRIGKKPEGHNTVEVACPVGKAFEIKHPNCTIKVPAQLTTGVAYKTDVIDNKHAITLQSTVENITTHYEAGICIFLGTTHQSVMEGSVTVTGRTVEAKSITATG
jgi:hypothetical protein